MHQTPVPFPEPTGQSQSYSFRSRGPSPFFFTYTRHSHRTLKDFQAHVHTHKIEINQAATTASRTNGAVSPLETNETKLFLKSTAPIWAYQMDKVGQGQAHPQV